LLNHHILIPIDEISLFIYSPCLFMSHHQLSVKDFIMYYERLNRHIHQA
jgi:hypothetical protein